MKQRKGIFYFIYIMSVLLSFTLFNSSISYAQSDVEEEEVVTLRENVENTLRIETNPENKLKLKTLLEKLNNLKTQHQCYECGIFLSFYNAISIVSYKIYVHMVPVMKSIIILFFAFWLLWYFKGKVQDVKTDPFLNMGKDIGMQIFKVIFALWLLSFAPREIYKWTLDPLVSASTWVGQTVLEEREVLDIEENRNGKNVKVNGKYFRDHNSYGKVIEQQEREKVLNEKFYSLLEDTDQQSFSDSMRNDLLGIIKIFSEKYVYGLLLGIAIAKIVAIEYVKSIVIKFILWIIMVISGGSLALLYKGYSLFRKQVLDRIYLAMLLIGGVIFGVYLLLGVSFILYNVNVLMTLGISTILLPFAFGLYPFDKGPLGKITEKYIGLIANIAMLCIVSTVIYYMFEEILSIQFKAFGNIINIKEMIVIFENKGLAGQLFGFRTWDFIKIIWDNIDIVIIFIVFGLIALNMVDNCKSYTGYFISSVDDKFSNNIKSIALKFKKKIETPPEPVTFIRKKSKKGDAISGDEVKGIIKNKVAQFVNDTVKAAENKLGGNTSNAPTLKSRDAVNLFKKQSDQEVKEKKINNQQSFDNLDKSVKNAERNNSYGETISSILEKDRKVGSKRFNFAEQQELKNKKDDIFDHVLDNLSELDSNKYKEQFLSEVVKTDEFTYLNPKEKKILTKAIDKKDHKTIKELSEKSDDIKLAVFKSRMNLNGSASRDILLDGFINYKIEQNGVDPLENASEQEKADWEKTKESFKKAKAKEFDQLRDNVDLFNTVSKNEPELFNHFNKSMHKHETQKFNYKDKEKRQVMVDRIELHEELKNNFGKTQIDERDVLNSIKDEEIDILNTAINFVGNDLTEENKKKISLFKRHIKKIKLDKATYQELSIDEAKDIYNVFELNKQRKKILRMCDAKSLLQEGAFENYKNYKDLMILNDNGDENDDED